MNREQLKALGLTDEQVDSVMKEYGKSINDIKEKADKTEALESKIEDYKQQIEERDTQLEELKKVDAKGLQEKIDELQQQNETTKTEYEEKLQQQAFEHKLESTLSAAKVKNVKAVKALLDLDSIKLDGEKLLGLDDQLTNLKENESYLFEQEDKPNPSPQIVNPGNPDGGNNSPNNDPFAAKLAKYNR